MIINTIHVYSFSDFSSGVQYNRNHKLSINNNLICDFTVSDMIYNYASVDTKVVDSELGQPHEKGSYCKYPATNWHLGMCYKYISITPFLE